MGGRSWLEFGGGAQDVTGEFGDWYTAYARSALAAGAGDVWFLESRWEEAFHDRGAYGVVANTHAFSPDWYSYLSAGAGSGRFHFPRFRADAALNKKWLPGRTLVTSLGGTFMRSKDVYRDYALFGGLTAYLGRQVIAEAGGRFNWSSPGSVSSYRVFGVLTLGRDRRRYLTLRGGAGTESYQLIGPGQVIRSFASQETSLGWRQWIGAKWGTQLSLEWYHNPSYTRRGGSLGVFRHW